MLHGYVICDCCRPFRNVEPVQVDIVTEAWRITPAGFESNTDYRRILLSRAGWEESQHGRLYHCCPDCLKTEPKWREHWRRLKKSAALALRKERLQAELDAIHKAEKEIGSLGLEVA